MTFRYRIHEVPRLTAVFDLDVRLRGLFDDLEREVANASLHLRIVKFATHEAFNMKHTNPCRCQRENKDQVQPTCGSGSWSPDS